MKIKVLQVSHSDSPGERFNGYDLMNALNQSEEIECKMLVRSRRLHPDVDTVLKSKDPFIIQQVAAIGETFSTTNLISPWVRLIIETEEWKEADIVHYQLMRGFPISVYDMNALFCGKKAVWTIHNAWPYTGGCIHPLTCQQWKQEGCSDCERCDVETSSRLPFAHKEYQYKRQCYETTSFPIIVSSNYMRHQIMDDSILSNHPIYQIPFGIKTSEFSEKIDTGKFRRKYNITENMVTLGFRNNNGYLKGCNYIFEALRKVDLNVRVISVGGGRIPAEIESKFECHSLPWLSSEETKAFFEICDIFLMPSLAESFGLMAIEAMSRGTVVISFQNTAPAELIAAPECGMAVEYGNADALASAISYLVADSAERICRSAKGKERVKAEYSFEQYVNKHIDLYRSMYTEGR